MATTAVLTVAHDVAQQQHLAAAVELYHDLTDPWSSSSSCENNNNNNNDPPLVFECYEGMMARDAGEWFVDPFALRRTHHDVTPRECLLVDDPASPFSDGAEVASYLVSLHLQEVLAEKDMLIRPPSQESQMLDNGMKVDVVNIVHSTYCTDNTAAANDDTHGRRTVFSRGFMWRRFQHLGVQKHHARNECHLDHVHLGCEQTHMYTSMKIRYAWPWKVSELLFPPGRILGTGSCNVTVSDTIFRDATLRLLQYGGARSLHVVSRSIKNIVAKTRIPDNRRLCMWLLRDRFLYDPRIVDLYNDSARERIEYKPRKFPGAIISHPSRKAVKILAFGDGDVVCVGSPSLDLTYQCCESISEILSTCLDTPDNLATETNLMAVQQPAHHRPAETRARGRRSRRRENITDNTALVTTMRRHPHF